MSKHVSLHTTRPLSVTAFYCVDGQEVSWSGPHVRRVGDLTLDQVLSMAESSFFDIDNALRHLQYLLRLDHILKAIDVRPRESEFDASTPEGWEDIQLACILGTCEGRLRASYLGKRPYVCCSEMSSGGLARGKSYAS